MSPGETLNYVLFGNPVSSSVLSAVSSVAKSAGIISTKQSQVTGKTTTKIMSSTLPLWRLAGSHLNFVRIAGFSGATAVILGAYGSHRQYPDDKGESKSVFETANKFHFFHSIALMAVPITRRPLITGSLMLAGICLFSGVCYYRAFTEDRSLSKLGKLAPLGGFCLILAWASMIL
uniref:Putative conserved plasma membrane protein n=1 Tax=Tabanus bromius TaxID=304241 RepID=A0A0K8TPY6_TABBR